MKINVKNLIITFLLGGLVGLIFWDRIGPGWTLALAAVVGMLLSGPVPILENEEEKDE